MNSIFHFSFFFHYFSPFFHFSFFFGFFSFFLFLSFVFFYNLLNGVLHQLYHLHDFSMICGMTPRSAPHRNFHDFHDVWHEPQLHLPANVGNTARGASRPAQVECVPLALSTTSAATSASNRREYSGRCRLTSKTSRMHATATVDDERGHNEKERQRPQDP